MIIRQGLNFAVHFAGGLVLGGLAVVAVCACRRKMRGDDHASLIDEPVVAPARPVEDLAPEAPERPD